MESIPLVMIREDLENIPQYPLPDGYQMRLYRPGDKGAWVRTHLPLLEDEADEASKISKAGGWFDGAFGDDLAGMEQRCYFLTTANGDEVGTITAWYEQDYRSQQWGRIHWVAIIPEHRRKGLGRPIMSVAMNCLSQLGHRQAMLATQTPSIPAIKVYLDFGFVPDMTFENAERGWEIVREIIDHPSLSGL